MNFPELQFLYLLFQELNVHDRAWSIACDFQRCSLAHFWKNHQHGNSSLSVWFSSTVSFNCIPPRRILPYSLSLRNCRPSESTIFKILLSNSSPEGCSSPFGPCSAPAPSRPTAHTLICFLASEGLTGSRSE